MHLWWYSSDGNGLMACDVISRMFEGVSEVTMSILILILATGWTVTYEHIDWDEDIDIFGPLVALVVIIHIMLAALDYVDIDASHKYHDYAGLQGLFLIGTKISLAIYFIYKMHQVGKTVEKRSLKYHNTLWTLGICYLSAVPMSILFSYMSAPYSRQYVFTFTSQISMFCSTLALFY